MYNINDSKTQSVAEAVKKVIENKKDFKPHMMYDPKTGKGYEAKTYEDHLKMKDMGYTHEKPSEKNETEVEDSDKDFVDLHTIDKKEDPEKKRQVEEKEVEDEEEVEESNEFTAAAAKAKLAGKDKFEFEGKTYPVEIGQDAAEKILGKKEEVEITEDVENFFGFSTKDELVKFQSMAKKLKIKPISNPTVMKRGGKEFHVMGFEGSVRDIEKAMKVAAGMQESVELDERVAPNLKSIVNIRREIVNVEKKINAAIQKGDGKTVDKLGDELHVLRKKLVNFYNEDVEIKEMFNRLKPDDVRDSYGTIELKYRSSADIRDAEDKLKKAGINVRKSGDTLEVNSDSPAFKKAKITSSFDSSKREKAIMKVLGESVELQEAASFGDIEKVMNWAKKNLSGAKLDISKKYGTAFINLTIMNVITLRLGGKKGIVAIHDDRTNGKGKDYEEYFSSANDVIKFVQKIYDEMPKKESADLEEALKPADFVKGGDAKVTKREVDGMLSKLFIDSKLAKAVEANAAYQDGYKGKMKKNPFAKDTADFHLFILGQQSAEAE